MCVARAVPNTVYLPPTTMDDFSSTLDHLQEARNVSQIREVMKEFIQALPTIMATHTENLIARFQSDLQEKNQKIAKLEGDVSCLQKQVSKLEEKIDDQDAFERRDIVIISGSAVPALQPNENMQQVVCQLLKDTLKLNVAPTEISLAHRLGVKVQRQGPDRRKILVKLCRQDTKSSILNAARTVKNPAIYINESLTPQRQTIAFALRKARKDFPHIIEGTSISNGKVFAYVRSPNQPAGTKDAKMPVGTMAQLENFCQTTLNTDASRLLAGNTH